MNNIELSVVGRLCKTPKFFAGVNPPRDRAWGMLLLDTSDDNKPQLLSFVAWGDNARLVANKCHKGMKLGISGEIRSYYNKTRLDGTYYNYTELKANRISIGQDPVANRIGMVPDSGAIGRTDGEAYIPRQTMKSAYEENKKRDTCCVCGKVLSLHPSVGVKYCRCVEDLPK